MTDAAAADSVAVATVMPRRMKDAVNTLVPLEHRETEKTVEVQEVAEMLVENILGKRLGLRHHS